MSSHSSSVLQRSVSFSKLLRDEDLMTPFMKSRSSLSRTLWQFTPISKYGFRRVHAIQ